MTASSNGSIQRPFLNSKCLEAHSDVPNRTIPIIPPRIKPTPIPLEYPLQVSFIPLAVLCLRTYFKFGYLLLDHFLGHTDVSRFTE